MDNTAWSAKLTERWSTAIGVSLYIPKTRWYLMHLDFVQEYLCAGFPHEKPSALRLPWTRRHTPSFFNEFRYNLGGSEMRFHVGRYISEQYLPERSSVILVEQQARLFELPYVTMDDANRQNIAGALDSGWYIRDVLEPEALPCFQRFTLAVFQQSNARLHIV